MEIARRESCSVAPLVGAWIEISHDHWQGKAYKVAPLVGAWIEILEAAVRCCVVTVAPLVGAWIEIQIVQLEAQMRSLSLLL